MLDTTAPVPSVLDAVLNSSTGRTTFTGTTEANSTVSIYDGNNVIGTTTAGANGSWSVSTAVTGNTVHSYSETSTDVAGNLGHSAGVALFSTSSNKALTSGTGNDVLIAAPNDQLTGGAGSDPFVFNPSFGKNTITDYTPGVDHMQINHTVFSSFADVQAHSVQQGASLVITHGTDVITLNHVTLANLHASDFSFI